jgi:phosphotransferase system  glucose/maltose/N-acetylglucosamine-specific IIC component
MEGSVYQCTYVCICTDVCTVNPFVTILAWLLSIWCYLMICTVLVCINSISRQMADGNLMLCCTVLLVAILISAFSPTGVHVGFLFPSFSWRTLSELSWVTWRDACG